MLSAGCRSKKICTLMKRSGNKSEKAISKKFKFITLKFALN